MAVGYNSVSALKAIIRQRKYLKKYHIQHSEMFKTKQVAILHIAEFNTTQVPCKKINHQIQSYSKKWIQLNSKWRLNTYQTVGCCI